MSRLVRILGLAAAVGACRTVAPHPSAPSRSTNDRSAAPIPALTSQARSATNTAPMSKPALEKSAPITTSTTSTPDSPPTASAQVRDLRDASRAVLKRQAEAYWKAWVFGTKEGLASAHAEAAALFTDDTYARLRAAQSQASGADAAALGQLVRLVASELVARDVAPIEEKIAALLAEARVTIDGNTTAWHDLAQQVTNEPVADQRTRLMNARAPVLAQLAPLARERRQQIAATARRLGFEEPTRFAAELHGTDPAALRRLAERTLAVTDVLHMRLMDGLATEELGRPLSKLRPGDLPRILQDARTDVPIGTGQLLGQAYGLLRSLGFDPFTQKALTLHVAAVPGKNPRPLCFPVDVPSDVRVSLRPGTSATFLREAMHELAHAEQFLAATQGPWELQLLGGGAVAEAFAQAFADIVDQPAFLTTTSNATPRERSLHVRRALATRLHQTRLAAAATLFELQLATARDTSPEQLWRPLASRALGLELTLDEARAWPLVDTGLLANTQSLQAKLLSAQLQATLAERHGEAWWRTAASGTELAAHWASAARTSIEATANAFGFEGLAPEPLVSLTATRAARIHP